MATEQHQQDSAQIDGLRTDVGWIKKSLEKIEGTLDRLFDRLDERDRNVDDRFNRLEGRVTSTEGKVKQILWVGGVLGLLLLAFGSHIAQQLAAAFLQWQPK